MMRVEGPGLEPARASLGLVGSGSQITELTDGVLSQVLDVAPIIRRGRTFGDNEGLFGLLIANVHPGLGGLSSSIDPYAVVAPVGGFPSPVPPGHDVWLISAEGRSSAAGVLDDDPAAWIWIQYPTPAVFRAIRVFRTEISLSGGVIALAGSVTEWGTAIVHPLVPIRVTRGSLIGFDSTALIAGTLTASLLLGIFPSGLGQDAG